MSQYCPNIISPFEDNKFDHCEQNVQLESMFEQQLFSEFGLSDEDSVHTIFMNCTTFNSNNVNHGDSKIFDESNNFTGMEVTDQGSQIDSLDLLSCESNLSSEQSAQSEDYNNYMVIRNVNYDRSQSILFNPSLESRLSYLRRTLTKYPHCINSGDINLLKGIISETFLPKCKFQLNFMEKEEIGREKLIFYLDKRVSSCPDVVITMSPLVFLNSQVMCARQRSWGTSILNKFPLENTNASEAFPYFDNRSNDEEYKREREKANTLINQRKLVAFKSQCVIYFILNSERTFIEKFLIVRKNIKISEYKDMS